MPTPSLFVSSRWSSGNIDESEQAAIATPANGGESEDKREVDEANEGGVTGGASRGEGEGGGKESGMDARRWEAEGEEGCAAGGRLPTEDDDTEVDVVAAAAAGEEGGGGEEGRVGQFSRSCRVGMVCRRASVWV